MSESVIFLTIGMVCLYLGAELLVKGGVALACQLGLPPLMVGLTIVSLSTSLPEAVVSILAQIRDGNGDVALANIVGSNIANMGLILGVVSLVSPQKVIISLRNRETPLMVGATLFLGIGMSFGVLSQAFGVLCFLLFLGYLFLQCYLLKKSPKDQAIKELEDVAFVDQEEIRQSLCLRSLAVNAAFIISGGVFLVMGGYTLIKGATEIALYFGISSRVIGLTVVALGTSLPELATSLIAALRKHSDIALGNIIGSNLFNILFIIGTVASISPISFSREIFVRDFPVMMLFSLTLWGVMHFSKNITRWMGALFLLGYCSYTVFLYFC
jgi:cation:H+ antiporter